MKIICFDLDNVICKTKDNNYKDSKPDKVAINLINKLYQRGYYIKIFTARYMGRYGENKKKVKRRLMKTGIFLKTQNP